jgi:RNA polymerase sigma factor (sigma-70 family)
LSEALIQLWPTCEPILVDAVRSLYPLGRVIEYADVVQQAALVVAEYVRAHHESLEVADVDPTVLRHQVLRRIREYVRAERRRIGRQVLADDGALERTLARRATGVSAGGASGRGLARAIEKLSPRQRAVVTALYFRDERVSELAVELKVTPQAITALHRRALVALRRAMSPQS